MDQLNHLSPVLRRTLAMELRQGERLCTKSIGCLQKRLKARWPAVDNWLFHTLSTAMSSLSVEYSALVMRIAFEYSVCRLRAGPVRGGKIPALSGQGRYESARGLSTCDGVFPVDPPKFRRGTAGFVWVHCRANPKFHSPGFRLMIPTI